MKRIWLIEARKEKGLKQHELAAKLEIAKSYLSAIENGERTPSGHTALRIAKELDIPMQRFFENEDQEQKEVLKK